MILQTGKFLWLKPIYGLIRIIVLIAWRYIESQSVLFVCRDLAELRTRKIHQATTKWKMQGKDKTKVNIYNQERQQWVNRFVTVPVSIVVIRHRFRLTLCKYLYSKQLSSGPRSWQTEVAVRSWCDRYIIIIDWDGIVILQWEIIGTSVKDPILVASLMNSCYHVANGVWIGSIPLTIMPFENPKQATSMGKLRSHLFGQIASKMMSGL